jgi:hypothetical protein
MASASSPGAVPTDHTHGSDWVELPLAVTPASQQPPATINPAGSSSGPVELDQNPLPEVAMSAAPESLHPIPDPFGQGHAGSHSIIQNDVTNQGHEGPKTDDESCQQTTPDSLREALKRPRVRATLVILFILIVIAATSGAALGIASRRWSPPPVTDEGKTTSTQLMPTPTPTNGNGVGPVPAGCDPAGHLNKVDFVGIYQGKNWAFKLIPASNAVGCCKSCGEDADGCNAWFFDGTANRATACSYIYGYAGPNQNTRCPKGRPDVIFNHVEDLADNWGGTGPCAGSVMR